MEHFPATRPISKTSLPSGLVKLEVGSFVLFYGDHVQVGDTISCAQMLEINGPKEGWKILNRLYYIAWELYGAFLDYHRFVEPKEKEWEREEEEARKKPRKGGKKTRWDEDPYDPYDPNDYE